MYPLKLDMTKSECRGILRRLELEAYSSVISTFRAQGSLDTGKRSMLDQLRLCFHISDDRHKAEARRVANSEKLTTISELMTGKTFDLEWIKEGHRSYPLIGRAPPSSALHILAEHASKAASIENSKLAEPADTERLRTWDGEVTGKVVTEDPTLPPPSPAIFGVKLKKSLQLKSARKKQHYQPPPPPNVKIQHLYRTLNTKRPRKSLVKKATKSPKNFELQRHLTSQLMPPPMSPIKTQYPPILPAGVGKKDGNLMKSLEMQQHQVNYSLKPEMKQQRRTQKYANGAGRSIDHIPDPQIIFNTTKLEQNFIEQQNNQLMASPLQLLSTAASCTPKLKVTPNIHQQQVPLPSPATTIQNRAIKIIPAHPKPVKSPQSQQQLPSSHPSKFKIQKFQLVMNKSQDGSSPTSLSPSATIVSGKAGQLLLSGKGITNSYQSPYTIVSAPAKQNAAKVIVQTIDRNFSSIPENQRITENTPIDFMPTTTSYPKVIIQKAPAKQIKLKLGANLVNPKIIPGNLKIQRNISSKGFTVVNNAKIVQLQTQVATQIAQVPTTVMTAEGTKVDWEQELDDVNRKVLGGGSGPAMKKIRLDENLVEAAEGGERQEVVEAENVVETAADVLVYDNSTPQIEVSTTEQSQPIIPEIVTEEFVFLNHEEVPNAKTVVDEELPAINTENGDEIEEIDQRQSQNGAEAYENLVKSLAEYEDLVEDAQIDVNFDNSILDHLTSDSGLFQ